MRRLHFSLAIRQKLATIPPISIATHHPPRERTMIKLPWLRSLCIVFVLASLTGAQELPKQYDLRKVNGITPIKSQQGGTCWAHGTCAAIESNLLMKGTWKKVGDGSALPAISEYHLDWWNGFNRHNNRDLEDATKDPTGMTVHQGGDYRVSAAYISRGDGVLNLPRNPDNSYDVSWFNKENIKENIPPLRHPEFKKFYVRDIEWFTIGNNLERIDDIKRRVMTEGAMGTAYCAGRFTSKDFVHYQPLDNPAKPNHAVAIVGWDDEKVSADPDR